MLGITLEWWILGLIILNLIIVYIVLGMGFQKLEIVGESIDRNICRIAEQLGKLLEKDNKLNGQSGP